MSAPVTQPNHEVEAIVCPRGFRAAGIECGIKKRGGTDLALIECENASGGASAAAMFTRNRVRAAPIDISEKNLATSGRRVRAVMITSGCANAATGAEGVRRAERAIESLATALRCPPAHILMNSTGVIGVQLPDEKVAAAVPRAVKSLSPHDLPGAARAIMTTDTFPKLAHTSVEHDSRRITVAGIAKGAGMIHPDMATMIAVLLTDADVDSPELDSMLRAAVDQSFHRISVDGDTSTNDSVFALASGAAGSVPRALLQEAMNRVSRELALMVVRDGEGARKLVHVRVHDARTKADALRVAQTVASSLLVRTAITGGDPNWGRLLAAVGRSGVEVPLDQLAISVCGVPVYRDSAPAGAPLPDLQRAFAGPDVVIDIHLAMGDAFDEFFTCDLTEGYVKINAEYTT